jgi:predicted MFS family arabinose efflux permease
LLLTFATVTAASPLLGILPAIVHARGGSIVELGLLTAALAAGALGGAVYGGARGEGNWPTLRYGWLGLLTAGALVGFAVLPLGLATATPLAVAGFVHFAEAVWNTARVRRLADPAYQARLQSLTTMAATLGLAIGALWSGALVDRMGITALLVGAGALGAISIGAIVVVGRGKQAQAATTPNSVAAP